MCADRKKGTRSRLYTARPYGSNRAPHGFRRDRRRFLQRLRTTSFVEGISTLVLFGIAMPLKYLGGMPMAVTIVGSIHGVLFLIVVAMFLIGIRRVPLGPRLGVAGALGAVFPFGPFAVDRWLARLESPASLPAPDVP